MRSHLLAIVRSLSQDLKHIGTRSFHATDESHKKRNIKLKVKIEGQLFGAQRASNTFNLMV
jgi:hypothetical protein